MQDPQIPPKREDKDGPQPDQAHNEGQNQSSPRPKPDARGDSDQGDARPTQSPPRLIARYGRMFHIGEFRHSLKSPPNPGKKVVVRTDRGVELAEVVAPIGGDNPLAIAPEKLEEYLKANGGDFPYRRSGRVLRAANQQDIIDQRHLDSSAGEEYTFCRKLIREMELEMKLVAVEHLLGGERIIFYFTAEHRVDFRQLVRRLAGQYRTRIEMRQVGARDEARLVADLERCGQRCCCQQFLKELKPVSMRMAKVQKATLDPTKISGRCGRLMCCLRYEDQTYEKLRKKLPKKNIWIRTEETIGKVIGGQIITQLVRIAQPDGTIVAVANEEIVEKNIDPPASPEEAAQWARKIKAAKAGSGDLDKALESIAVSDEARQEAQKQDNKPRKKRRRRKKKKPSAQAGQSQSSGDSGQSGRAKQAKGGKGKSGGSSQNQGGDGQSGSGKKKRRRRPRRRKKKPQGSGGSGSSGGGNSGGSSSG
jgi:cell fate regulator YaaT (PSP1 superfamily)